MHIMSPWSCRDEGSEPHLLASLGAEQQPEGAMVQTSGGGGGNPQSLAAALAKLSIVTYAFEDPRFAPHREHGRDGLVVPTSIGVQRGLFWRTSGGSHVI